jgi:hypothetical protein
MDFDGNACAMGAWLFLDESIDLITYRKNLNDYYELLMNQRITMHFAGHTGKGINLKKF